MSLYPFPIFFTPFFKLKVQIEYEDSAIVQKKKSEHKYIYCGKLRNEEKYIVQRKKEFKLFKYDAYQILVR